MSTVLSSKFLLLASLLGPMLVAKDLYAAEYGFNAVFAITLLPGLLMGFAALFTPDEDEPRFGEMIIRLGYVGMIVHVGFVITMIVIIARGYVPQNPGFVLASVIATPLAAWNMVRPFGGTLSDDIVALGVR